jgi:hypothetical protein
VIDKGFGLLRGCGGLEEVKRGGRGGRRERRGVEIRDWIYRRGAKIAEGRENFLVEVKRKRSVPRG